MEIHRTVIDGGELEAFSVSMRSATASLSRREFGVRRWTVFSLLAAACAPSIYAQSPVDAVPSPEQAAVVDPLNLRAPYGYIMDADTGVELYCKQCNTPLIPASMSKLMVYYLVFERIQDGRLSLDDEFTVSEHAWRTGGAGTDGSTMFLDLGSRVRVEDLIRGAVVQSGNDACIVLAEGIAGTEGAFADMMTARARELGLNQSTFANATGLDHPEQRMSAADIGLLSTLIIERFPEFYPIFSEPEFTWNGIRQFNRNPLMREIPGADGVKTGHLSASGYGLAGSAERDGERRVIVLQGMESEAVRRQEGARVMRAAFNDFEAVQFVEAGAQVGTADVWLGVTETVPLVVSEGFSAGLHVSSKGSLSAVVQYTGPIEAPVTEGDVIGELVLTADGMATQRLPVTAGASVARRGLIGRAIAGLRGD